jgi:para-nitrobenzyl esterase
MNADNTRRANAQTLGELKSAQGKAPSFLYYFNWRSPVHNGQMKSYHTLDIPFVLYNVDIAGSMTGAGQVLKLVAANSADRGSCGRLRLR